MPSSRIAKDLSTLQGRRQPASTLSERLSELHTALVESDYDVRRTWCSALRRLVEESNRQGDFDDILEHPTMSHDANQFPTSNPLDGLDVATISALYEFVLATEDMGSKRKRGQFFTPDDISTFMARRASGFPNGVWLDPCCGVGNLSHALVTVQDDPEDFLLNHLICSDIDELALFTARVLKTLSFQRHFPNLFTSLAPNFQRGNFLRNDLLDEYPFKGQYDFVLMNPPYAQATDDSGTFRSAPSRDLFAFFLEQAASSSKGFIAITPQAFTNGKRHAELREVLLESVDNLSIYCFDNVPDTVFRGLKYGSENSNRVNSTRAAITVGNSFSEPKQSSSQSVAISPLLRWKSSERSRLLDQADVFLTRPVGITSQVFPKVYPGLEDLYGRLIQEPLRLRHSLSNDMKGESLHVPTTPRYFISAVKRDLERSSQRLLTFSNSEDMNRAYLILNSSLTYFWWRAHDGGMTISSETLLSVPIPSRIDFDSVEARSLISHLEESEESNLVTKLNAGKLNENVKHPLELIDAINSFLELGPRDTLLNLHSNSCLTD